MTLLSELTSAVVKCSHQWDKETGIRSKARPWVGIKSQWERTCKHCGKIERFDNGRNGFHGWFTSPDSP